MPYAQTWTGGLAAQARLATWPSRRATSARASLPVLADLQLQRDQHRRERLPQRVPPGAAEPARRTSPPAAATRSATPARRAPSPLPIFLAYFTGCRPRRRRQHRRTTPARTGRARRSSATSARFNPHAVQLRQHRRGPPDRQRRAPRQRAARRPAGELLVANPDLLGGAEDRRQRRRHALQLAAARAAQAAVERPAVPDATTCFGQAVRLGSATRSRGPRAKRVRDTGTDGGVDARVQGQLGLRAAVRPGPALRQQRRTVARSADRRLVVRRHRPHPERHACSTSATSALVGMSTEELQDSVQAALRRCRASWSTCCRRTSSTTRSRRSASARRRRPATAISGAPTGRYLAPANGPDCIEVAQTASTARRLRRAQPRRHRADAGAVRPQRGQAVADQGHA